MAFAILGTPKPRFDDSAGAPLVSGTITIQNPGDSAVKSSYPTAADADADTNGTSGDITLDGRGEPSGTQLWGRDNEDYKIIIKDSSGSTIYTLDAIQLPDHSRRAAVTFTSTDATPTIAESDTFITAGTTAITDFDDGQVGDTIYILAASTITITHGSPISLKDVADYKMVSGDTLTLAMYNDQVWEEIARTRSTPRTTVTFTSTDATPTIKDSNNFITAGTTAITDFDDGRVGDTIYIRAESTITITHGSPVSLLNQVDFAMLSGDSLTLTMFNDQIWEEVGRSVANQAIELTATKTVTEGENGKTFYLNASTEFVTTLPAPALGLKYTFIIKGAAVSADYTLVTNASANIMDVFILDIVGELTYAASRDVITFVDGGATGDRVTVESDGTNWFCLGFCGVDGKMTTGQT